MVPKNKQARKPRTYSVVEIDRIYFDQKLNSVLLLIVQYKYGRLYRSRLLTAKESTWTSLEGPGQKEMLNKLIKNASAREKSANKTNPQGV